MEGITRNLDQEAASLLWKRRNVEASPAQEGTQVLAAAPSMLCSMSTAAHLHVHKQVIIECSVQLDQEDIFWQFLEQIAMLIRNAKIVDKFFVINLVIISNGKKDWKEVSDVPQNMMALGGIYQNFVKEHSDF